MRIDPKSGLIDIARQVSSPNWDDRPQGCEPELIVIHGISLPPGQFGGTAIDDFFCNKLDSTQHPYFVEIAETKVSAHVLIRRDGEVVQYVPLVKRAWHAGQSSFAGKTACNDFSIGIELEGTDDTPYTDAQYERLAGLVADLINAYPRLAADRIVGHSDISPGRKTDPGSSFNWEAFRSRLKSELQSG